MLPSEADDAMAGHHDRHRGWSRRRCRRRGPPSDSRPAEQWRRSWRYGRSRSQAGGKRTVRRKPGRQPPVQRQVEKARPAAREVLLELPRGQVQARRGMKDARADLVSREPRVQRRGPSRGVGHTDQALLSAGEQQAGRPGCRRSGRRHPRCRRAGRRRPAGRAAGSGSPGASGKARAQVTEHVILVHRGSFPYCRVPQETPEGSPRPSAPGCGDECLERLLACHALKTARARTS